MYSTTAHNTIGSHFTLAEVLFHEIVQSLFELCKLVAIHSAGKLFTA